MKDDIDKQIERALMANDASLLNGTAGQRHDEPRTTPPGPEVAGDTVAPLPYGYSLRDGFLVFEGSDSEEERDPVRICGQLDVLASTTDDADLKHGKLIRWHSSTGHEHRWTMPISLIAKDVSEIQRTLLDAGLYVNTGKQAGDRLKSYLQLSTPAKRVLCVSKLGWYDGNFVLPDTSIGPAGGPEVLFQTERYISHHYNVRGTLAEWRENVAKYCSENSRLLLTVSAAFAGPLVHLAGSESGGIHLHGKTTSGKSTALLAGGSVLGGNGEGGFTQTWRATANGLEAVAALHNDSVLFLDEMAQLDPRDAETAAYLLANGVGKLRMDKSISSRERLTWSLLFISAGELTLSEHAGSAGKRLRGGAELRLLNVDADSDSGYGLIENLHGFKDTLAFAHDLKESARKYYGTPIREYLARVTKDATRIRAAFVVFRERFLEGPVPAGPDIPEGYIPSSEVKRAAERFALIAFAGELATDMGITGWARGDAHLGITRCFWSWRKSRAGTGDIDAEAGVSQVRKFIEQYGPSRFEDLDAADDKKRIPNERAGFRRTSPGGEVEFLFLSEVFKKVVCSGLNYRDVAHALDKQGLLVRQDKKNLMLSVRVPGNSSTWVYCVKGAILSQPT